MDTYMTTMSAARPSRPVRRLVVALVAGVLAGRGIVLGRRTRPAGEGSREPDFAHDVAWMSAEHNFETYVFVSRLGGVMPNAYPGSAATSTTTFRLSVRPSLKITPWTGGTSP
jgi:hypothetical protein